MVEEKPLNSTQAKSPERTKETVPNTVPQQPQVKKGVSQFDAIPKVQPPPKMPPPATAPPVPPAVPPAAAPLKPDELKEEDKRSFLSKSKILFLLIAFFIFFVTSVSLTLAYTDYVILTPPLPIRSVIDTIIMKSPLPKNPRMILSKAAEKMGALKSATVETEISMSTEDKYPIKNVEFAIKGPVDFKSQNQSKSQFDISGSIEMEGMALSAAGSIRQIEDKLYFMLTEIPAGSFLPFEQIKNKWFVLTISDFTTQSTAEDNQKLEQVMEIVNSFVSRSYEWTSLERSTEKGVYTLVAKPPKEEIIDLLYQIVEILEPQKQTSLEKSLSKEKLDEITNYLENLQITLKIGRKDYLISEVVSSITVSVDAPKSPSPTGQIELPTGSSISLNLSSTIRFTDYNRQVIVDIPQDAINFEEYLNQLQNSMLNQLNLESPLLPGDGLLPENSEDSQKEEKPSSFYDLLDDSVVLGEKTYWDIILLRTFGLLM